ncbi:uncharacterized protein DEA37_0011681 [Paragonimus westermani]|uniref:Integrase zinc-binding domain-containing protein n=1 Tax=Paragonimus westermani TaxID=34504 RepID=A0A5J4NQU3_9TREM|nr:uncharacterized protein DEA37_0011681 [Paragonimus westermani]
MSQWVRSAGIASASIDAHNTVVTTRRLVRHPQNAARLTKHWSALIRLLAANGTELQVVSPLSASVQLGSFGGEHQFLACSHLQWEAILRMDFLGRFGGVLNLKDSQISFGSCIVDLERDRSAEVCSTVDSKAKASFEIEHQTDGSSKPSPIVIRRKPFDERASGDHWKDFKPIDGVLYRVDQTGPVLITPKLEVAVVLQKIHIELGHAGQVKTDAATRQPCWWQETHACMVTQCLFCETCSAFENHTPGPRASLEPVVTEHAGQRVRVDIMCPLPVTKRGNRYISALMDYFTKWSEDVPIKRKDACIVAAAIVNE